MSEIWRDKNDTRDMSPSCLATIFLFVVLLAGGFLFLASFLSTRSGDLLKMLYPYAESFAEKDVTAEEMADFSNSWHRIAEQLNADPMSITNGSLALLKDMIIDQNVTKEEIAELKGMTEEEK